MAANDVTYFKETSQKHRTFFTESCKTWQSLLSDETVPEDAQDEIRTTVGLTELLLNQKLKQFEGLVTDCELKQGEKTVTCEDLQGFYDMIYFEIEKLQNRFNSLEKLQANNWVPKSATPVKKQKLKKNVIPAKKPTEAKANPSTKDHILAARKRLAEAKAKALANANKENDIQISLHDDNSKENLSRKQTDATKVPQTSRKVKKPVLPPLSCVTRSMKRALSEKNTAA